MQECISNYQNGVSLQACTIQLLCSINRMLLWKNKLFHGEMYCEQWRILSFIESYIFPVILDMVRIDMSYLIVFTYYILSYFYASIDAICGYIFLYLLGTLYWINYFSTNLSFLSQYLTIHLSSSSPLPVLALKL